MVLACQLRRLHIECQIEMYKTSAGKCPFDEWLQDLTDYKAEAAIDLRLGRVKRGNFGQCELLGGGVYELKIDFGPGYRVYFGKTRLRVVLLLCAGSKRSQRKDIERAKKYLQDSKTRGLVR